MKILSVSLHNIASIEGPFTLNLEAEPLKSVGLFAITGATGAGKSTILDAIALRCTTIPLAWQLQKTRLLLLTARLRCR